MDRFQKAYQFKGRYRIQVPSRFICQNNFRFLDNGSGETGPLLFTSREFVREMLLFPIKPHQFKGFFNPARYIPAFKTKNMQGQSHIFKKIAVPQ